jgi:hypothetical protein
MVLITPRLVRALDPDEVPPLPTRFKPFMTPKKDDKKDKDKGGNGGDLGKDLQGVGTVDAPEPAAAPAKTAKKKSGGR